MKTITLEFRSVSEEQPPPNTLVYWMQNGEGYIHAVELKHRPDEPPPYGGWTWEDARSDLFEKLCQDDMWAPIPP